MKRGFTLIEYLLVFGLLALIGGMVTSIISDTWKTQYLNQSQTTLYNQTRASVDAITRIIKQSSGVVSSVTIAGTTYTTGNDSGHSVLVLRVPAINASQEIIPSADDYFVFLIPATSSQLLKITQTNPASARQAGTVVLATNASAFGVTYYDSGGNTITSNFDGANRLKIKLTSQEVVYGRSNQASFVSAAALRNK